MFLRLQFIGNLGQEPEMRYTPSGKAVTNFTAAVNKRYTDSAGELHEITIWVRVSTWGNLAEACKQYLAKGSKVYAEGELVPDPETGGPRIWGEDEAHANFEMRATYVEFLDKKSGHGDEGEEDEEFAAPRKASRPQPKAKVKAKSGKQPWME